MTDHPPQVLHFLIRDGAEPLALRIGEVLRFGRHEGCEVRLESKKASRRHAHIEWQDGRAWVRDLGSNNGSFVNDERIDCAELLDGDELRFATYIAIYRRVARIEELASNDSTSMTTTGVVPTFSGHLQHSSLLEVLSRLQQELANGQVNLLPRKGSIGLVAGEVAWAEAQGLAGEGRVAGAPALGDRDVRLHAAERQPSKDDPAQPHEHRQRGPGGQR